MGIHGLTKLLGDVCPDVLKETKIASYFGRKVAIDASMFLYSFLVAIRPDSQFQLTDESGETTSHLQGMFNRTVRLVEQGIKPCYVFDGKPPTLKSGELAKRSKKKEEAKEELVEARETGNQEEADKIVKRTVRVTAKHNEECKKLLRLMGIPVIEAPCEAEAQCAELCRAGKVFATGTEDMDALTLGTPILLRHLTYAEARKMPILEIHLSKVLEGLNLTMAQFIDLCILCGCDYCDSIKGIGPKRALEYITKYGSIEGMLTHLDKTKYPIPERFDYESVRLLFKESEVAAADQLELKWSDPDEEGLKQFLVNEKQFNLERVERAIERLKKQRTTAVQGRLDAFFGPPTIVPNKRKREEEAKAKAKAKAKGKGKGPAVKRAR